MEGTTRILAIVAGILLVLPAAVTVVEADPHCKTDQLGLCEGYDEDDYEDNGNKICSVTDSGWIDDTDNDGTVDCLDPDNDGDFLTDEYEDAHDGYNLDDPDTDGDGVVDPYSIRPKAGDPFWGITAWDYDGATACDGGASMPDPWISFFQLSLVNTWDEDIPVPPGWQEGDGNHIDDRGTGVVSDLVLDDPSSGRIIDGEIPLEPDIRDYGTTSEGIGPRVEITIRLNDHDGIIGDNEVMDLSQSADTDGSWLAFLTLGTQRPSAAGDDPCWGMLQFSFADNVLKVWICTALEHFEDPDKLIGMDNKPDCT